MTANLESKTYVPSNTIMQIARGTYVLPLHVMSLWDRFKKLHAMYFSELSNNDDESKKLLKTAEILKNLDKTLSCRARPKCMSGAERVR